MDIYPLTSELATWDIDLDANLATATADVELGGAWHALTWAGAAVEAPPGTWTREARLLVKGASGAAGQLVVAADYQPDVRITVGGEVVIRPSTLRFRVR